MQEQKTGKEKFLSNLRKDNVFVDSKIVSLSDLTGMPVVNGISRAIISEGQIVHAVSDIYQHLPNEKYFYEIEAAMIEADINYEVQSTNRDNCNFAVDYILNDYKFNIDVKNTKDRIIPMLRFTNSYNGGIISGHFGYFRELCTNGLHIAQTRTGFKVLHRPGGVELVIPNIKKLVEVFMSNEYYSLSKKFEVLAETPIKDLSEFVKFTCTKLDLFKYEKSEKNPDEPSKTAQIVIDTINREAGIVGVEPNLWLGYNAFNEHIHNCKKGFSNQRKTDIELFSTVMGMAN